MNVPGANFTISEEERQVVTMASDFENLIAQPGWKRIMDFLISQSDEILSRIRLNRSNNSTIALSLQRSWNERQNIIDGISGTIRSAIEARDRWVEELKGISVDENQFQSELLRLKLGMGGNNAGNDRTTG